MKKLWTRASAAALTVVALALGSVSQAEAKHKIKHPKKQKITAAEVLKKASDPSQLRHVKGKDGKTYMVHIDGARLSGKDEAARLAQYNLAMYGIKPAAVQTAAPSPTPVAIAVPVPAAKPAAPGAVAKPPVQDNGYVSPIAAVKGDVMVGAKSLGQPLLPPVEEVGKKLPTEKPATPSLKSEKGTSFFVRGLEQLARTIIDTVKIGSAYASTGVNAVTTVPVDGTPNALKGKSGGYARMQSMLGEPASIDPVFDFPPLNGSQAKQVAAVQTPVATSPAPSATSQTRSVPQPAKPKTNKKMAGLTPFSILPNWLQPNGGQGGASVRELAAKAPAASLMGIQDKDATDTPAERGREVKRINHDAAWTASQMWDKLTGRTPEMPSAAVQAAFARCGGGDASYTQAFVFDKDGHTTLQMGPNINNSPASMSKVIIAAMLGEAMAEGNISLRDKVRVSDFAAHQPRFNGNLHTGEVLTVEQLLKGTMINSYNGHAVALVEAITEANHGPLANLYVKGMEDMNAMAKKMGMQGHFVTAHGAPHRWHDADTGRTIKEYNHASAADFDAAGKYMRQHMPHMFKYMVQTDLGFKKTGTDYSRPDDGVSKNAVVYMPDGKTLYVNNCTGENAAVANSNRDRLLAAMAAQVEPDLKSALAQNFNGKVKGVTERKKAAKAVRQQRKLAEQQARKLKRA